MNSLISAFLSGQNSVCKTGIENCKTYCENKLENFKQTFRRCFAIKYPHTIDSVLEQANNPLNNPNCWKEMRLIAEKYKKQSFDKLSFFSEDIQAGDIVNCGSIRKEIGRRNMDNLVLNMCYQAQVQRQHEEQARSPDSELAKQQAIEDQEREEQQAWQTFGIEEWEEQQERMRRDMEANVGYSSDEKRKIASTLHQDDSEVPTIKKEAEKYGIVEDENDKKSVKKQETVKNKDKKESAKKYENIKNRDKNKKEIVKHLIQDKEKTGTSISPEKALTGLTGAGLIASITGGIKSDNSKKVEKRKSNPKTNISSKLIESQKKSLSSKNTMQLAQAGNRSGKCPVNMPQIKSAVVFQSVEAPQIESMNKQTYLPYNDYDLARKKPAGILVQLNKANMNMRQEFRMALFIQGDSNYRYECFHKPLSGIMSEGQESICLFYKHDSNFKFFPLPMYEQILNKIGKFNVTVVLYPRGYSSISGCLNKSSFYINIVDTGSLNLTFTRINGGKNCYSSRRINTGYSASSFTKVKDFVNSDEVSLKIESMFPVRKVTAYALKYRWKGKIYDYIEGYCNRSRSVYKSRYTKGFLSDIGELEITRQDLKYDKIMAIVPDSYFLFHRISPPAGLIIKPTWMKIGTNWFFNLFESPKFIGGSWNVAFINSSEKNRGTVSHELAHLLGQEREFYEPNEKCQHLRTYQQKVSCATKFIPRFLDTGIKNNKQFWELITNNRYSVMGDQGNITNQWIDRDTYQKSLKILSTYLPAIPSNVELYKQTSSLHLKEKKIVVSGLYNREKSAFVVPKIRVYKTKLVTPSSKQIKSLNVPVITIQLKEKNRILQTIKRPIFKMEIELLYRNQPSKKELFDFSHVMAAFKLPKDSKKRELWISVLSPKGKVIYSEPIPKELSEIKEPQPLNIVDNRY